MHFKKTSKLVNFCAAILILKMEEDMQHFQSIINFIILRKLKNVTEMQKKTCTIYGEGAVTDRMCQSGL